MTLYLVLLVAASVSMAVIPLMRRAAPRLGLIDLPGEERKVHKAPVPRVGGWGIVAGMLLPVVVLLQPSPLLQSWLAGVAILFLVGVLDDIFELGHYPKFLAQIAAALVVVLHGRLWIWHMPLLGLDPWPAWLGLPFTVFAIVGMINAINHSDGLDGLAGGEALLSLLVILFIGLATGGEPVLLLLAAAAIGGVLGFLRYNTHPATVFMGDAGSQVLGFTLALLVIDLTQRLAPVLSPAVVLFILGLPVMDIVAVLILRIWHGMNWFKASRNHIHHRLLDLGLDHYEVVVVIYALQGTMVGLGLLLRFEHDALVLVIYALACTLIFGTITALERRGWRAGRQKRRQGLGRLVQRLKENRRLATLPGRLLLLLVLGYLLLAAVEVPRVPVDFGWMSLLLLAVVVLDRTLLRDTGRHYALAVAYVTAIFLVFLDRDGGAAQAHAGGVVETGYFLLMALLVALTVKFDKRLDFGTTPLDYLMVLGLVTLLLVGGYYRQLLPLCLLLVKGVVLLYGLEVSAQQLGERRAPLYAGASAALAVMALRGLL